MGQGIEPFIENSNVQPRQAWSFLFIIIISIIIIIIPSKNDETTSGEKRLKVGGKFVGLIMSKPFERGEDAWSWKVLNHRHSLSQGK